MFATLLLCALLGQTAAFTPPTGALRTRVGSSSVQALAVGDKFPAAALGEWGIKGKKSVVYFYGGDEAPSCTKEAAAFGDAIGEFKGVSVVGVRSDKQVKEGWDDKYPQKFVVDVDDKYRKECGIPADLFGLLGGRETYVLDASGTVQMVFNDQFAPEKHVSQSLDALAAMTPAKAAGGNPLAGLFGK